MNRTHANERVRLKQSKLKHDKLFLRKQYWKMNEQDILRFLFFNCYEENVYLPLGSAFHEFAFPETARQFASSYSEKHKIYS